VLVLGGILAVTAIILPTHGPRRAVAAFVPDLKCKHSGVKMDRYTEVGRQVGPIGIKAQSNGADGAPMWGTFSVGSDDMTRREHQAALEGQLRMIQLRVSLCYILTPAPMRRWKPEDHLTRPGGKQ
jgi:hypothetical protein